MMNNYRFLSVYPQNFQNNCDLPNSRATMTQEKNISKAVIDCWRMDGNNGNWTTILSNKEIVVAGEKIRFAFWAKFAQIGSSFWLELAVNGWEKRTIHRLDNGTSQLVAKEGEYHLFVVDYDVHESGTLISTISVNNFEAFIFVADESDVTKYAPFVNEKSAVIDFHIPFTGFENTNFINCFTSTYIFLNNITGNLTKSPCEHDKKAPCNVCGSCKRRLARVHEKYFFIFDTLSGRSATRRTYNGQLTEMQRWLGATDEEGCGSEDTIEFLFGLAGFNYQSIDDKTGFHNAISTSIDSGKPLLAKVKGNSGRFRVITGYRGHLFTGPSYAYAQNASYDVLSLDDIDVVYVIGESIQPTYTFADGLDRIIKIMSHNIDESLWSDYYEKMGVYTKDSFRKASNNEKKLRMKIVADTMWHTFNCHNFAEVFRLRHFLPYGSTKKHKSKIVGMAGMEKLADAKYDELISVIDSSNGYTHDLAWALIRLESVADWSAISAYYIGEMVELTLMRIADNDKAVLQAVKEIRESLSE